MPNKKTPSLPYKFYGNKKLAIKMGFTISTVVIIATGFLAMGTVESMRAMQALGLLLLVALFYTSRHFFLILSSKPIIIMDEEGIYDKTNRVNAKGKIYWSEIDSFTEEDLGQHPNRLHHIVLILKDPDSFRNARGLGVKFKHLLGLVFYQNSNLHSYNNTYILSNFIKAGELDITNTIIKCTKGKVRRLDEMGNNINHPFA